MRDVRWQEIPLPSRETLQAVSLIGGGWFTRTEGICEIRYREDYFISFPEKTLYCRHHEGQKIKWYVGDLPG